MPEIGGVSLVWAFLVAFCLIFFFFLVRSPQMQKKQAGSCNSSLKFMTLLLLVKITFVTDYVSQ